MKIYTKKGDSGSTSLAGGERVAKDDLRVEAYGSVDELSAVVAYLRDSLRFKKELVDKGYDDDLRQILNTLMSLAALLAMGKGAGDKVKDISDQQIEHLETRIDAIDGGLVPIKHFTIPGGDVLVSLAHICRTVCRRAERAAVRASREYETSANVLRYLNRLSDYFYILGRVLCRDLQANEELWQPSN